MKKACINRISWGMALGGVSFSPSILKMTSAKIRTLAEKQLILSIKYRQKAEYLLDRWNGLLSLADKKEKKND